MIERAKQICEAEARSGRQGGWAECKRMIEVYEQDGQRSHLELVIQCMQYAGANGFKGQWEEVVSILSNVLNEGNDENSGRRVKSGSSKSGDGGSGGGRVDSGNDSVSVDEARG